MIDNFLHLSNNWLFNIYDSLKWYLNWNLFNKLNSFLFLNNYLFNSFIGNFFNHLDVHFFYNLFDNFHLFDHLYFFDDLDFFNNFFYGLYINLFYNLYWYLFNDLNLNLYYDLSRNLNKNNILRIRYDKRNVF